MPSGSEATTKVNRPINEYFGGSNVVKIYVRPKRKLWVLPEDLVCDQIDFFRVAFKSNFKKGKENETYLEEDDPIALQGSWTGSFAHALCVVVPSNAPVKWSGVGSTLLADKWGLNSLMLATLRVLRRCIGIGSSFTSQVIVFVYSHDAELLPFREMLVELAVRHYLTRSEEELEQWLSVTRANSVYDVEVAKAIKSHIKMDSEDCPWIWSNCDIHRRTPSEDSSDSD